MSYSGSGTPQLRQLARALEGLGRGSQAELTKALAAESLSLIKRGFDLQETPYGQAWKPNFRGGRILRDTSRLYNAFQDASAVGVVKISNPTRYAAIQNYGGDVVAKNAPYLTFQLRLQGSARAIRGGQVVKRAAGTKQWVRVKKVHIPARQFIPDARGLPLTWETRLEAVARRAVRQQLKGRS